MSKHGKLVGPWRQIHAAIWLIGLAILAWRGWWWPGILVLVGVSAIVEAVIQIAMPSAVAPETQAEPLQHPAAAVGPEAPPSSEQTGAPSAESHRADLLPAECPKCGAPVRGNEVHWTGSRSADCPYCGANLPVRPA